MAYAKHAGGVLVTNDHDNGTADIYEAALSADRIITLKPGETITSVAKRMKKMPLVLDFGGFVESRVIEAAAMAQVVVVPLSFQSTADLTSAVRTITTVEEHCPRVVILINNTAKEHVIDLADMLKARFPKHTIMTVPPSRYIRRLADDGLTLHDLAARGGIERYQLRTVLPPVEALHAALDQFSR